MIKGLFDSHVHTNVSPSCNIIAEEACKKAIDIGLAGIAFCDHFDLDYPEHKWAHFFDSKIRYEYLKNLKQKFKNKIKILDGVEVGIQQHVVEASSKFVRDGNFDFVICSTHVVDNVDPCEGLYFQGKTQKQAYQKYLESVYASICNFKDYDVVGHIGYVRKYGNFTHSEMKLDEYGEIIDAILKKVIADGKGIEINTSGYRTNLGSSVPCFDIIKRYCELGGEILTIGSDAHCLEYIGDKFDFVREKLLDMGIKNVAYFESRKPVFIEI